MTKVKKQTRSDVYYLILRLIFKLRGMRFILNHFYHSKSVFHDKYFGQEFWQAKFFKSKKKPLSGKNFFTERIGQKKIIPKSRQFSLDGNFYKTKFCERKFYQKRKMLLKIVSKYYLKKSFFFIIWHFLSHIHILSTNLTSKSDLMKNFT